MNSVRPRLAVALAVVLLLHLTVLADIRLAGVRPDAPLLIAIVAGLAAGPERGAIVGFVAGLLADLFLPSPFGLSALVYSLVGFAIGSLQTGILRNAWWIPVVTAFAGSAAGIVLYAALGAMVGETGMVGPRLPLIAVLVG
ncbi:MAG TPA: rod shape-determining protein MreD, partial [Actinomycetota bacterium]|nr:rod shape-determining protein MreD [Actinomycetota bacterium]